MFHCQGNSQHRQSTTYTLRCSRVLLHRRLEVRKREASLHTLDTGPPFFFIHRQPLIAARSKMILETNRSPLSREYRINEDC